MSALKTPDIDAIEKDVQNVDEARSKLEDILNDIADKNDEGRTPLGIGDDPSKRRVNQTSCTPTKRSYPGRYTRKKKKKDLFQDEADCKQKPSYVLKLFDRYVNLAKFEDDTSVYKMLHDWMKNKPSSFDEHSNSFSEMKQKDSADDQFVYSLPNSIKEEGEQQRVPFAAFSKKGSIEEVVDTNEEMEKLKESNMSRWRNVRQSWRKHSFEKQRLDTPSIQLLKSMIPI